MTDAIFKSIGLLLRGVALFSPRSAGKLAFRIFSAAPGNKPESKKEAALLAEAKGRLNEAERHRLIIDGALVSAFAFAPAAETLPRGKVLVVHGYRSRTEHMLPIIDRLTANGFLAVGLDLPGHGHSRSSRAHLVNAVQAIDAAWREFDGFDAYVAHSFGGASVIAAAAGGIQGVRARRPYKIATIASPTRLQTLFDWFAKVTSMQPEVRAVFEDEVLLLSGRPLSAYDAARHLSLIRAETLVFHAPDDKEVPFESAEKLAAAGPHVRLKPIAGYGHRRILASPVLLDELVHFLTLPSTGAEQSAQAPVGAESVRSGQAA